MFQLARVRPRADGPLPAQKSQPFAFLPRPMKAEEKRHPPGGYLGSMAATGLSAHADRSTTDESLKLSWKAEPYSVGLQLSRQQDRSDQDT